MVAEQFRFNRTQPARFLRLIAGKGLTMGFYSSPEDMFSSRAKRFKRDGDRHWAMAKAGLGAYHYGKAKFCYDQSKANQLKAAQAAASGATFKKGK